MDQRLSLLPPCPGLPWKASAQLPVLERSAKEELGAAAPLLLGLCLFCF